MEEQKKTETILKNISFLTGGEIEEKVEKMTRDMKFFSIFYIIYGVLISLTLIGAILGIPMIIYHLKLKKSAESYRHFIVSDDFFFLNRAFEDQQKFFFFHKVLLIIGLILLAGYFFLMIYLFSRGMMLMPSDMV